MKSSNFICTVGPTNSSVERVERMIYKGMAVARLNFSHGSQEEHLQTIRNVRLAAQRCCERNEYFWPVAIAVDLRGPEIRTGKIENLGKVVEVGDVVKFNDNPLHAEKSSSEMIHTDRPVTDFLKRNHQVLINDGSVQLTVEEVFGNNITCRVTTKGVLASNQTVFIPEIAKFLNLPVVSEKDKADIQFAAEHDVDFIFASYVECGEWVDQFREVLKGSGGEKIKVFAKIQNRFGVDEIEEIVRAADGIIISPTVDLDPEMIPFIQRMLLSVCKEKMKPCLMKIDSEITSSEMHRLVNWFMELGDGVVVTRDASQGKTNPLESMMILKSIRKNVWQTMETRDYDFSVERETSGDVSDSLASASVLSAFTINASAIVITSDCEKIVQLVYFHKPKCEVAVVMENAKLCRQLNIFDRVTPLLYNMKSSNKSQSKVEFAINFLKSRGTLKCGDTIIVLKHENNKMEVHYVPYDENL